MSGAKNGIIAFLRDTAGNVLPMAAIGMLLSAALVGGGIDMSRAYRVQNRLQSACDSAALAGRRAVTTNGFDTPSLNQANGYFDTNFDKNAMETSTPTKAFSSSDNGQTVVGTASADLNLAVMKIFGFQKFRLSVTCQASMGVGNSDVIMVLDTTGSMNTDTGSGTRIAALRTAMKNFYTTVKTATTGTNARIRYGFVPFSSSVNVGRLLYNLNTSYLVDSYRIQSREPVMKTVQTFDHWGTPVYSTGSAYTDETESDDTRDDSKNWTTQQDCQNKQPANIDWANNGSSTTSTSTTTNSSGQQVQTTTVKQPQIKKYFFCKKRSSNNLWYVYYYFGYRNYNQYTYATSDPIYASTQAFDYWNYHQILYDSQMATFKTFSPVTTNTGSSGAAVTSTWRGCIEERATVSEPSFTYSTVSKGITPVGSYDLDIDTAPTSDPATKWAPMWPQVAYIRETSGGSLTNNPTSKYGDDVGSYCPYQAQLLAEMSQSSFNTYADALYPEGSTYLDIGMLWGARLSSPEGIFSDNVKVSPTNGGEVSRHLIFMTDGIMEPNNSIQSAYGIEYHDRRVTDDGSSNHTSRHTSRFLAICDAVKAKGIRVWTISFTSGTNSSLSTCASANSYYNADNPTQLNAAFQEIAKQVGELRLTQ